MDQKSGQIIERVGRQGIECAKRGTLEQGELEMLLM